MHFVDVFEVDYDANWEPIDRDNFCGHAGRGRAGRVPIPHEERHPRTKVKITMPKFVGGADPEAYQKWEIRVDKIFRMQDFSEDRKIKLASLEFEDYALLWWEKVQNDHRDNGQPPIITWEAMKREMRTPFVPVYFRRDVLTQLQELKQGAQSVEDYYKQMEQLLIWGRRV